jgi:hypothetical protein
MPCVPTGKRSKRTGWQWPSCRVPKGRVVLTRALGQQQAANLYRHKLAKLSTAR